jgi:hypothetical protein
VGSEITATSTPQSFTFGRLAGIRNKSFPRTAPLRFGRRIRLHRSAELSQGAVVKHCLAGLLYLLQEQGELLQWFETKYGIAQERGNPGSTIYRYSTRVTPSFFVRFIYTRNGEEPKEDFLAS